MVYVYFLLLFLCVILDMFLPELHPVIIDLWLIGDDCSDP